MPMNTSFAQREGSLLGRGGGGARIIKESFYTGGFFRQGVKANGRRGRGAGSGKRTVSSAGRGFGYLKIFRKQGRKKGGGKKDKKEKEPT